MEKEKKDHRRGLLATVIFHVALFLIFLFVGLKYYDPKPEEGIAINFGNVEQGLGDNPQPAVQTSQPKKVEQEESQPEPQPEATEPVQTQNQVDAPELEKEEKEDTKEKTEEENTDKKEEEAEKEEQEEEPQPSKSLQDLLKNTEESESGGEGNTKGSGDQGDPEGDPDTQNRTGSAGGGGGSGNYLLGNRQAIDKPKPNYEPCDEEGKVVVSVFVDRKGQVTGVQIVTGENPSDHKTTVTSSCLFDEAKKAARKTTWQADSEAPITQIGYITYTFYKQ